MTVRHYTDKPILASTSS